MFMMASATAADAADEFIMTYLALRELDIEYAWFRPMLTAIATELMSAVAWGVKVRAYLGAGVSAADALSDAYMINEFYEMGDTGTAKGLLAMVGANLAFQTIVVLAQSYGLKKNKWRTMLFEMLTVVAFVKPGIDAHRVASGAEQPPGAKFSPLIEMIYTKGGELVFEAIPGLVRDQSERKKGHERSEHKRGRERSERKKMRGGGISNQGKVRGGVAAAADAQTCEALL
jgi:hypothetical protein